ncbi:MAG: hypothetical protein ACI3YP_07545 [Prevotella sp.]
MATTLGVTSCMVVNQYV